MSKSANPFILNTHDLPRRAGEMKEYQLDIPAHTRTVSYTHLTLPTKRIV